MVTQALKDILDNMAKEKASVPELKAGKLYRIKPVASLHTPGDLKKFDGYRVTRHTDDEKFFHRVVFYYSDSFLVKRNPQNFYALDQVVMALQDCQDEEFVDLLIDNKTFENIVYRPIYANWRLEPIPHLR